MCRRKKVLPKSEQWRNYQRKKIRHQCFSMGKILIHLFLCPKRNNLASFSHKFLMKVFFRKRLRHQCFNMRKL